MNNIRVALFSLASLLTSGHSMADPVTWVKSPITGIPSASTFDVADVQDTFSGEFHFTKQCGLSSVSMDCDFSFAMVISDTTGLTLDFSASSIDTSTPGACSTLLTPNTFSLSIPHGELPTLEPLPAVQLFDEISFSLPGFSVTSTCGSCSGTLEGTFSNTGGGTLSLSGSLPHTAGSIPGDCHIEASSAATSATYLIWHP